MKRKMYSCMRWRVSRFCIFDFLLSTQSRNVPMTNENLFTRKTCWSDLFPCWHNFELQFLWRNKMINNFHFSWSKDSLQSTSSQPRYLSYERRWHWTLHLLHFWRVVLIQMKLGQSKWPIRNSIGVEFLFPVLLRRLRRETRNNTIKRTSHLGNI